MTFMDQESLYFIFEHCTYGNLGGLVENQGKLNYINLSRPSFRGAIKKIRRWDCRGTATMPWKQNYAQRPEAREHNDWWRLASENCKKKIVTFRSTLETQNFSLNGHSKWCGHSQWCLKIVTQVWLKTKIFKDLQHRSDATHLWGHLITWVQKCWHKTKVFHLPTSGL